MPDETNIKLEETGSIPDSYISRSASSGFDLLRPWKIISQNNIYIVYLSVLLFAMYAFARHGFNWIALSTSLIVSVPIGFAIAFFETQSTEFWRIHWLTQFCIYRLF